MVLIFYPLTPLREQATIKFADNNIGLFFDHFISSTVFFIITSQLCHVWTKLYVVPKTRLVYIFLFNPFRQSLFLSIKTFILDLS